MQRQASLRCAGGLVVSLALASIGCGLVGPSCVDKDGAVFDASGQVAEGRPATYTVTSPVNSNLLMRLTWPDTAATLGMRATITACGGHVGCGMVSFVPLPSPPGLREMQVDGWKGKTYLVEVTNSGEREASFALQVTYRIRCGS